MKPLATPPTMPLVIVISGPSGVGKDAVLTRMKEQGYSLEYIVTATTRLRRPKETNNIDYHFVSNERFEEMIKDDHLLEWANVYDKYYGVPRQPIKEALNEGKDVIVKVDVQGAATIKKKMPQAVFIFLLPSSMEELTSRLRQRFTESSETLEQRLGAAAEEIEKLPIFDYVVVNRQGKMDLAVSEIKAIITAEKCRLVPREITL